MDRSDQAFAMLRENRDKGLSLYDSRQILIQNGFSNAEIDDAADRLYSQPHVEQTAQTGIQGNLPSTPTTQLNPPDVGTSSISNVATWYVGMRVKAFILFASFAVVFAAGNYYSKHHSPLRLILYFAALGLSALTAIYLNLISNIRGASGKNQQLLAGIIGIIVCLFCFVFLWFVSMSVLG